MKKTTSYPTKNVGKKLLMKCMNSEPEFSKYGRFAPEEGPCDEWVAVNPDTISTLCSKCVQRVMSNSPISKVYDDED